MTTDLVLQPAHVQLRAMGRRQISSRELLALHLARIDASDVNAVVTRDDSAARQAAHAADERRAHGECAGVLDGLPLTVKDSFETAGMRTTCGTEELRDHYPELDADAVARLRFAGAVVMGTGERPLAPRRRTGTTLLPPGRLDHPDQPRRPTNPHHAHRHHQAGTPHRRTARRRPLPRPHAARSR